MLFKALSSMRTWLNMLKCILVITKLLGHVKATEFASEVTLSHWESNRKWLLLQDGRTSPSQAPLLSLSPSSETPFPSSPPINSDPLQKNRSSLLSLNQPPVSTMIFHSLRLCYHFKVSVDAASGLPSSCLLVPSLSLSEQSQYLTCYVNNKFHSDLQDTRFRRI